MNKSLKIAIISFVIVVTVIISVNVYVSNASSIEFFTKGEPLAVDNYEITLNDAYNADFAMVDSLNYNFDKYLAVDLSIKNTSDTEQKFNAFKKFFLDDGTDNARHFLIDENQKKFGATLEAGESFDLTLVFPVDNATEYTLFYNKSLKAEDDKRVGFRIDGTNLETKKVENSAEHFEINLDDNSKDEESDETEEAKNAKA